jgi:predicted GNAT family acetyltransferase
VNGTLERVKGSHDPGCVFLKKTEGMEVEHIAGKEPHYQAVDNGDVWGEMTYSQAGDALIIIDHTRVFEGHEGKGVGQALVIAAVERARKEGFKIMPLCPFARAMFERHPEWSDVLHGAKP